MNKEPNVIKLPPPDESRYSANPITPANLIRTIKSVLAIGSAAIAGALLMAPATTQGALMAYEGFNYAPGNGNLTGQNGGFGWNGSWQGVVNGSSSVQSASLVAGANAPGGFDAHSTGNYSFTPNGTRTGRHLDTSAGGIFGQKGFIDGNGNIGAAGKTIYISFLQQPNIANNNYYEFEFHRGDLNDGGRVGGVGCDTGGSSSVYLRTPAAAQTLIGPASTAVSFYVVRIDFMGGNDTVTVYQNPTSATEPASPTLVEPNAGDMSFNGFSFGAFVNGATVAHDEVRVGETWDDVVNPAATSAGIWDGGGTDGNWSSAGNWDNDTVPVFATSLTFAGSTRLTNTNDLTGISANNITFDAAAGAFTLFGNNLGLNTGINFNGNPAALITETINLPLTANADIAIETRTNGNVTINGDVSSPNNTLTQTSPGNAGVLTLAGTNTLGGFIVNGGTNRITGNTTITGPGGTRFCLANGNASLKSTLDIESGANLTINGSFADSGVIGRDGGIATVNQNGGTFNFWMDNQDYLFIGASGNSNTRGTYNMNGGVLDMNGKNLGIALGANTLVTGVVNQVSGVITNVGNLYFSPLFAQGHGIYNLTGGSIYIGANGITVFNGGGYELNLGGGTIGAETSWSSALNMTLTGSNGPVTFAPQGNVISLSGALSGPGGLTLSGGGTLELSGANTYSGDTTINGGTTLQLDVTGSSAGAFHVANSALLNLNFSGNYAVGSFYTNGVALPVGTYNAMNLPDFIIGPGNLQVTSGISTGLWTGNGADNNWSTGGNWDNNAVPIFPHSVTFAGNAQLANNNDLSGITVSGITFDSAAGAFTVGGNDILFSGGIGFNGNPPVPITQTINLGMTFSADQTFNLPTNGNLSLGGNLISGNGLVKSGAGTLTLSGAVDTFSALSVNGGTNIITGSTYITGTGDSRFYIGDIGTVGNLVIQSNADLEVSGNFGDAGVIGRDSGSGTIVQNGGTFNFNPANVANLFVGASSSAATRASYTLNGGTLNLNNYTLAVALSANGGTLITGVVSQTSGSIQNVGKLLLGAFNFGPGRGIYRMTGGSIQIGANGIQTDSGVYEVYLGGGTVSASTSWSSPLNMTLTGSNGPVTFDTAGSSVTLSGILSGPGGLNVTGGGLLELSGANTYLGDTMVSSGILQLDATGSSAGAFRVANGAYLTLNYSGTYIVSSLFTNGVAVQNGVYNASNLPGYLLGSGNLQVVGGVSTGVWDGGGADGNWSTAGNWDHNAEPIFPIDLTFAGAARLNNTNDVAAIAANSITFDATAGAFTLNGNGLGLNGNISFNGNPSAPVTQTINLPLTANANINLDAPANANLVLNGNFASYNNTTYSVGNGTVTFGGENTFAGFDADGGTNIITGTTTVTGTGGTRVYVANADYLGGCVGTLVIPNGGTFNINGTFADAFVVGRDGGKGTIVQNGGVFNFNPGNQTYLFIGAANNPATRAEYQMNGGVLDMNGKTLGLALGVNVLVTGVVNQVSGVITNVGQIFFDSFFTTGHGIYNLTGGSLYIGSGGMVVQSGGTYEVNFGGGTVGALANWSSSLDVNLTGINGPVNFNTASNTITLSGALSGAGGLTVSGGGTVELSGANTYTGDTMITTGSTLRLDSAGTTTGTFRVADGAKLNLSFIGNYTVGTCYTNGVALPNGTYNSTSLPGVITGAGSLVVAGSIPSTPASLTFTVSAGHLNITWPAGYQGWILQEQTNSLNTGLGTNWVDVTGSESMTSTNIPIDPTSPSVFYRLRYPTP